MAAHSGSRDGGPDTGDAAPRAGAPITLGTLAHRFDLQLVSGAPDTPVQGVCALDDGAPGHLAYAGGRAQRADLENTAAGAVIVPAELAGQSPAATLVGEQPQLAFARIAALFEYRPAHDGIHPSAVIHPDAWLAPDVAVGAHAVIGAGCEIGAQTRIGANTVLGDNVAIREQGLVGSNVSIHHHVRAGARVRIEPGAVLGARGFGLVHNGHDWEPIPQLGAVVLGDDVEVGAASTIDRGSLTDTVIGDNVRIDNHVHIAHNCRIGAHTVIAGCTGIAGSCTIGGNCMIGGGVGISDHVRIVDNVMLTGATQVPRDITEPGVWSSTLRAMPAAQWRRLLARFGKLVQLERRLKRMENNGKGDAQE